MRIVEAPVVAIVGRPNTGKSTLFNRLTGARRAVVAPVPGVTRDRNIGIARHRGREFLLVDTGGFEEEESGDLQRAVQAQSLLAAEEADSVIVLFDGRTGLGAADRALFDRVRRLRKPVFVAVNKIDTARQSDLGAEFYALGVERVYPISAEHGLQVSTLMDDVVAALPQEKPAPALPEGAIAVAIIGRPNVGKSSLLNRLVGYERAIVSPIPGTTRDPVDTAVRHNGQDYVLVDTAGIRRRSRVQELVERVSVIRAFRALERAEVALLVIDATEGMTEQDARISSHAWERGRALVLVVNKWDAVERQRKNRATFEAEVVRRYPSLAGIPAVFVSALTGQGVTAIWPACARVAAAHRIQIQTAKINQVVMAAERQQPPPVVKGKRPKFFYATQTGTSPPTITIFTSHPSAVQPAYERYLVNQIRHSFSIEGTPIRLRFRAKSTAVARRGSGSGASPGGRRSPAPRRHCSSERSR